MMRGSPPRPIIVKSTVEKSPNALIVVTRDLRSLISGTENVVFSAPLPGALCRMYIRRSSSLLTSGRSSTPRTTLKIAALAPMPSASVTTTVSASPLTRASDRKAKRKSVRNVMSGLLQAFDVELIHLHQRRHHPLGPVGVLV